MQDVQACPQPTEGLCTFISLSKDLFCTLPLKIAPVGWTDILNIFNTSSLRSILFLFCDLCSSVNYIIHPLLTFLQVQQRISQLSYEAEQNDFGYSLILYFFIGSTFPSPVCRYSALVKGFIKTCLNGYHGSFGSNRSGNRKQGKELAQVDECPKPYKGKKD